MLAGILYHDSYTVISFLPGKVFDFKLDFYIY